MSTKKSILRIFSVLFILTFILALTFSTQVVTPAYAASLTVNSLADAKAVDGLCTLREAIQNANDNAATNPDCATGSGTDTITFSVSGTLTLGSGLPTIGDKAGLTVDGSGRAVTIDGHALIKILSVTGLVPLTLINLTFENGATGIYGGAIENYGSLTILNSTFSGNHNSAYDGGAIYNQSASVIIQDSIFSGNSTAHNGGGIYSLAGTVTIIHSTFTANTAAAGGAINCYDCTLNVSNSTFSDNNTPNGAGGAIFHHYNSATITDSVFTNNGASYGTGGGGIYSSGGGLMVTNSTFTGNTANGSPGGAIYMDGSMDIRTSTFSSNSAGSGGGIYTHTYSSITNSTFSANTATDSSGGGVRFVGGYVNGLSVTNSTFSGNSATGGGGGISNSSSSPLTTLNTLVAKNIGGNCSGTITNGGNNLDDGITCGWGTAKGSLSGVDPLLGALIGSPAYFPLTSGSPAIDKGDDSICAAAPVNHQSQNGVTRPQGAHCDIGAFELDSNLPRVYTITRANLNPTKLASVSFAVTFSEPVTGVDVSDFGLTTTGVSGAAVSGVSGSGSMYTVVVNTGSGTGTIRLDVVDNDTILDQALNPLGGVGAGNGNYISGEIYAVRFHMIYLSQILK